MMLKLLEQYRDVEAMSASAEHWAFWGAPIRELQLDLISSSNATEQILRILLNSIPFQQSPLARALRLLESLDENLTTYIQRRESSLPNWRDKPTAQKNISELRKQLVSEHDLVCRDISVLTECLESAVSDFLEEAGLPEK